MTEQKPSSELSEESAHSHEALVDRLCDPIWVESVLGEWLGSYPANGYVLCRQLGARIPGLRIAYGDTEGMSGKRCWIALGHPYRPIQLYLDYIHPDGPLVTERTHHAMGNHTPTVDWSQVRSSATPMPLDASHLADPEAREWAEQHRHLCWVLWSQVWADGMLGWPSREIMRLFLDTYPGGATLIHPMVMTMVLDERGWWE